MLPQNPLNAGPEIYNPQDPVSGMAAMPRNMTGMAMKMSAAGYLTHMFGKWCVASLSLSSVVEKATPHYCACGVC